MRLEVNRAGTGCTAKVQAVAFSSPRQLPRKLPSLQECRVGHAPSMA